MRIPRRTPLERADSLAELHELLYSTCSELKARGVSLAHVWLNRSSCPHAVESTSSLVQATLVEETLLPSTQECSSWSIQQSEWTVRSSYSIAIIRFVNSVADAFQTGAYAQSIFTIAERIGLPAWFVEVRHAATHEELPSLEMCRQATHSALEWLNENFWRPNVGPSLEPDAPEAGFPSAPPFHFLSESNTANAAMVPTNELDNLSRVFRNQLAAYRKVAKVVARDQSLLGDHRGELEQRKAKMLATIKNSLNRVFRGHAGGQMNTNANALKGHHAPEAELSDGEEGDDQGLESNEVYEVVVECLLEPGGIIPLSKKKRPKKLSNEAVPTLPAESYETWSPLLSHLCDSLPGLSNMIFEGLLDRLSLSLSSDITGAHGSKSSDASYVAMAASWLVCLFGENRAWTEGEVKKLQRRTSHHDWNGRNFTEQRISRSDVSRRCLLKATPPALDVARHLCSANASIWNEVGPLIEIASTLSSSLSESLQYYSKLEAETETGDGAFPFEGDDNMQNMLDSVQATESRLIAIAANGRGTHGGVVVEGEEELIGNGGDGFSQVTNLEGCRPTNDQGESLSTLIPGWKVAGSSWEPTPMGLLNGSLPRMELQC